MNNRKITSPIVMGQMPLACFSKTNSHNATNMCDIDETTWPWTMCLHISKNRSKPLVQSLGTKQSCKSSYTIPEGISDERRGKHVKVKINVYSSKTRSIFGWKSLTKGGRSTLGNRWKWGRVTIISTNGVVGVLGANACIT